MLANLGMLTETLEGMLSWTLVESLTLEETL